MQFSDDQSNKSKPTLKHISACTIYTIAKFTFHNSMVSHLKIINAEDLNVFFISSSLKIKHDILFHIAVQTHFCFSK